MNNDCSDQTASNEYWKYMIELWEQNGFFTMPKCEDKVDNYPLVEYKVM